jgi:hypothetical protein
MAPGIPIGRPGQSDSVDHNDRETEGPTVRHDATGAQGDVVLVVNAGTDAGYQIARDLLRAGYRVAATSRHAAELTRIMHGYSPSRVLTIAADTGDPTQVRLLINRIRSRFGRIDVVMRADCRSVFDQHAPAGDLRHFWPPRRTMKSTPDIAS